MKTGNTTTPPSTPQPSDPPQWSPVMKTGNTWCQVGRRQAVHQASMEPGHEDREYIVNDADEVYLVLEPQWSPVMKTGNTGSNLAMKR